MLQNILAQLRNPAMHKLFKASGLETFLTDHAEGISFSKEKGEMYLDLSYFCEIPKLLFRDEFDSSLILPKEKGIRVSLDVSFYGDVAEVPWQVVKKADFLSFDTKLHEPTSAASEPYYAFRTSLFGHLLSLETRQSLTGAGFEPDYVGLGLHPSDMNMLHRKSEEKSFSFNIDLRPLFGWAFDAARYFRGNDDLLGDVKLPLLIPERDSNLYSFIIKPAVAQRIVKVLGTEESIFSRMKFGVSKEKLYTVLQEMGAWARKAFTRYPVLNEEAASSLDASEFLRWDESFMLMGGRDQAKKKEVLAGDSFYSHSLRARFYNQASLDLSFLKEALLNRLVIHGNHGGHLVFTPSYDYTHLRFHLPLHKQSNIEPSVCNFTQILGISYQIPYLKFLSVQMAEQMVPFMGELPMVADASVTDSGSSKRKDV